MTLTVRSPTILVKSGSKIELAGLPTTSEETIGSVPYSSMPARGPAAAVLMASFTPSTVTGLENVQVKSTREPSGTGTLTAKPSSFPFSSGITSPMAAAAPHPNRRAEMKLASVSAERRADMLAAGYEVRECYRVLEKAGINLVGEILRGQNEFIEFEHYPRDDVFDNASGGQYYYHAHREAALEHGHFHTFLRAVGMPPGCQPIDYPQATDVWPTGDAAISHLVARDRKSVV